MVLMWNSSKVRETTCIGCAQRGALFLLLLLMKRRRADPGLMRKIMSEAVNQSVAGSEIRWNSTWRSFRTWLGLAAMVAGVVGSVAAFTWSSRLFGTDADHSNPPPDSLPSVTVSPPLQRDVAARLQFLGQFSGVERVELRAQVGGTLTQIGFKDGDVVKKGGLLFVIDPEPYEIKLANTTAQLKSAKARAVLASQNVERAIQLKPSGGISAEEVDKRSSEERVAKAAVEETEAMVRDARFDVDHCRITAPFTGRIGTHLVSVGNLVAGSRAASSPTTLLTTLVSLDPIYLNFDMSEADYMTFLRTRGSRQEPLADKVEVSLSDETTFRRQGTLDFIDNALNRSSGTIRARATVPNGDLLLTPGGFARVRLAVSSPAPALLVPDSAVLADQSEHIVLTVGSDDTVTPKRVKFGDLRGGLRVIRSGLAPTDRVVIDGIATVRPGSKVSASAGSIRFNSDRD
jgi:membrane fusion protein, multidrug efflux system